MPMTHVPRYLNRELSLLAFQERVLALAVDPANPLLERVKYVAIVSQNLDEFFQVRIAGLQEQVQSGVSSPSPDGMTPLMQLNAIRPVVEELVHRIDEVFLDELLPGLEPYGIRLANWAELDAEDRAHLSTVFEEQIFPVLTPLAFDPSHPFPFISNLSLNLAVRLRSHDSAELQFARVKVPPILSRFVVLPDGERFLPLEQLIAAHLDRLFGGREVVDHYMFRVTRNADLAVEEEEADDLLEAMETVLRFRHRSAHAVRLEAEMGMPDELLNLLRTELQLSDQAVYRTRAPLALGGLWSIWGLDHPELKEEAWTPVTQPRLAAPPNEEIDFFEEIKKGDILVHHPYESFASSTGAFVAQAARDPRVLAIKQTLYRTSVTEDPARGGEEAIVRSLMAAAQLGKQVVVLVELKARFDEEANITWARMLEDAGVHVVYGVRDLKTHAKALLVVRREDGRLRRYAHLGTGNYNPKTARIYEDFGLFTADPAIGADLSELFNSLTGYAETVTYRKLLVAPHALRNRIADRIREEAAKGTQGRIAFKINHLVDPEIIDELYAASQQGCRIDLIVRGICCLRAGIPGLSETIRVRSIVGEFLEHSRVYRFGDPNGGAVYFMGSADVMQRNLNRRVETLVAVTDPRLKMRLEEMIEVNLTDDMLAWEMKPDGSWAEVPDDKGISTHARLKELAIARARAGRSLPS
jgi:polyphosphate kinase